MRKLLKNQQGFTLVELMVVVAIIAILSTIAIPNFKKFQSKAKTSEAKLHLSSIYSAEVAFLSDSDVFGTCLKDMGYDPSPQIISRYYSTGFNSAVDQSGYVVGDTANGVPCTTAAADGSSFFPAGKYAGAAVNLILNTELQDTGIDAINGSYFQAGAQGAISPSFMTENVFNLTPLKDVIGLVVGKAYAASSAPAVPSDVFDVVAGSTNAARCATGGTKGTSLFSINDVKNIKSKCTGY